MVTFWYMSCIPQGMAYIHLKFYFITPVQGEVNSRLGQYVIPRSWPFSKYPE